KNYGRMFRPTMLVRTIKPLQGRPRITLRLRPAGDYGAKDPVVVAGSNHIRYVLPDQVLRLTTNAPVTALLDEISFQLDHEVVLLLGPDEVVMRPVEEMAREFHAETVAYWRDWVRYLALPLEWQEAVIRAAITLKLCTFEDTGAVIAAVTTSIPEHAVSGRNWDYRYCWIRDSYFVIRALNRLGATHTMESYLHFIDQVAATGNGAGIQPLFGIGGDTLLEEHVVAGLPGYRSMGP